MDLNIRAGMRVLYKKNNSNWMVGEIGGGSAAINESGLFLPIWSKQDNESECTLVNIKDLFFDGFRIDEAIKTYKEYFMTKVDYIAHVESDDFDRKLETAFVSDGEYGYYPVSKFTRAWLEKQPFDYVVRSCT